MIHNDHVNFIRSGIPKEKGVWADFGSGDGAFTLALAELAHPRTEIFSVDKDRKRLDMQESLFDEMYPKTRIHFLHNDFTKPLDLPPLDGIIMANSLHFLDEKVCFLQGLQRYLKDNGRLIIVEYNVEEGNTWVPYPFSFSSFQMLAKQSGFTNPQLISIMPSQFLNEIYAAGTFYCAS